MDVWNKNLTWKCTVDTCIHCFNSGLQLYIM